MNKYEIIIYWSTEDPIEPANIGHTSAFILTYNGL